MSTHGPSRRSRSGEKGYAILLMMFFLALLVLSTIALAPDVLTDDRRAKEEEMVWRGKQYVRGIRLFYQKNHRFPTQLEDLYKPKTGIRFMRQAFKDPMNTADGSWRLIYVGPNGQLIGSLKTQNTVSMSGQSGSGFGGMSSTSATSTFGGAGGISSSGSASGNSFSTNSSIFGSQNPSNNPGNLAQGTAVSGASNPDNPGAPGEMSTPQPIAASTDTGPVIGGNIIGVGSKINKKSFKWYEKAKNYRLFEFIWDPSVDSLTGQRVGQIPLNNAPLGSNPSGTSPTGFSTPTPTPAQNPPFTPGPGNNPPLQAPPPQN